MTGKSELVVVITGASSGNGRAIAHQLAREGAKLVLVARSQSALDETALECTRMGGTALTLAVDVGNAAAVEEIGTRTLERFGRMDVWVNCAAIIHFGRIEDTPSEVIDQVLHTNINGYFNGTRVAIRHFRGVGAGTLINVSSVLAITGQPYASAYVASKAAVRGLSESVRQEVADAPGIHVCSVLPYAIDTPIYQRAANYSGQEAQPVVPRYPASVVADAVVGLIDHPRREVYAGKVGVLAAMAKAVLPPVSDGIVRTAVNTVELSGRPAAPTQGNAFAPIHEGWKVSGGWTNYQIPRVNSTAAVLVALAGLSLVMGLVRRPRN